jgi:hypothetical protein
VYFPSEILKKANLFIPTSFSHASTPFILLNHFILQTPIASAVRGARSAVLDYLTKDMPPSDRADALMNANETGESPLTVAEKQNVEVFNRCQSLGKKTASAEFDLLDRSNRVVAVLLDSIPQKRLNKFEHEHNCFKQSLSYAEWFMSGGGGGKDGSSVPGVVMADYD